MAKDFKAKQIRTTQIIGSGLAGVGKPGVMIYTGSSATDVDGGYGSILNDVESDVWMYVGGKTDGTENVYFAGNVKMSGSTELKSLIIGSDVDGTDRTITFGHGTIKTVMGIDDSQDLFTIHTGGSFGNSLNSDFEIDTTGNIAFRNADRLIIGPDDSASDRTITFGHDVIKTRMGIDTDQSVFAINTDPSLEPTNDFEIDGSGNVTIGNGTLTVGGNIIRASDGGSTITMDTSDNVTIGNDLTVGGNVIRASDGGATITMDTNDNVTIGNRLIVGDKIEGAADIDFRIESDGNLEFMIDADGDEAGQSFKFYDRASLIMELNESGDLQIDGDLTLSGHDIKNSDSETVITIDADQKTTFAGVVVMPSSLQKAGDSTTSFGFSGGQTAFIKAGGLGFLLANEDTGGAGNVLSVNYNGSDIDFVVNGDGGVTTIHTVASQDAIKFLDTNTNDITQSDVNFFVQGTANSRGTATRGTALFAGDLVVSGTLYAEKQVMEVNLSQPSDLHLSGAIVLGDIGAAPDGTGQTRIKNAVLANSGSLFVATGSLILGTKTGGTYTETEVTPKVFQADNGIGSQVVSATNTSFHLDINGLTGSLGSADIVGNDLFAVADTGAAPYEVKKITLTDLATKLAGSGIGASAGVLSIDIDGYSPLGGIALHQTEDHFLFSDNGTEKKISFSNLEDAIFANVTGDASIAAGGDLSLGIGAVRNQADLTGDVADTDELLVGTAAGALNRVDFSVLRDAVFNDISGDATVAAGGAMTIAANAVEGSMINSNVAGNGVSYVGNKINLSLTDVSGSNTISTLDSIPFLDVDGSTQISTVAQLVTALAGAGISNSSNQFALTNNSVTVTAGDGLQNGGSVNLGSSVTLDVDVSDFAGAGLEDDGSENLRIAAAAAGNGLSGGGGSPLAVGGGIGIIANANDIQINDSIVATISGSSFTGPVLSNAFSGSLTHLTDGSSYIIAGANVSITTGSNGAITVAATDTNTEYTAGDGINLGGTEFSIDLKSSGGLKTTGGELEVEPNEFAGAGLEDDGSDNLRIATSAAGVGLTGGGGSALSIDDNVVQRLIYFITGSGNHGYGTANAPSSTGVDAIAIGRRTKATGHGSIAIGAAQASFTNTASGINAAALGGDNVTAEGDYSAVLGGFGNAASGSYSVAMGRESIAHGTDAIAIGKSLTVTESNSIAIGNSSNNAKIALSGSVEIFSDLIVPEYINHAGDSDTFIRFINNGIKLQAGANEFLAYDSSDGSVFYGKNGSGAPNHIFRTENKAAAFGISDNQVLVLSGGSANSTDEGSGVDVAFYVSGSLSSQGTSTRGTALFGGDVFVSGTLRGPSELQFDNTATRIFRDGTVLKFDDASNDVKTLSQLAATGASTEHFVGVHGGSPTTSKLKTTASVAFAGASDNFVDGLTGEGVGLDTFVFFSGSIGSRGSTTRGVTLFGGDSVFSGSATYLGNTEFSSLTATGDVTAGGSFVANGNTVKNSNGDKVFKFSSGTGAVLMGDGSLIDSTTPSAFLHIENAENVQAGTTNETSNFNILLRNSTVQSNAFAGIAFDVSTELDADSIGAAIRAERDTSAGTTAANHATNLTFATNNVGDDTLTERMRITHDGKVGIGVEPGYSLDVAGDIRVRGGDIRDMSGNVAISFDGSANTTVENTLTVNSTLTVVGALSSSAGQDLYIGSAGNMTFAIDSDNNEGSQSFLFQNNGSTDIFEITEAGDINVSGDIMVAGNDIKDSGGNTVISFDGSGNIDNNVDFTGTVDFEGNVNVAQYIQHLSDTHTRLVFNDDQLLVEVAGIGFMKFHEDDIQDMVVINEGSHDIDFRVESNNETHMFFVDANTDRIGMGISGPATTLEIKGASADETALQLKDSQSSDTIVKLYHANGEDDGIIDVYADGVALTRIDGGGDSFFRRNATPVSVTDGGHLGIGRYDTGIDSGDELAQLEFQGSENNSTWYTQAAIQAKTNVAWGAARGAQLYFYTTPSDSTTMTETMVLTGDGNLQIDGTFQINGNDIIGTALKLDSAGDITLSADGNQITMDDGASTRFTFNLDSTPELDVTGDFTIDGTGDVVIDGADDVIIKNNGTQRIQVEDSTGDVAIGTHDPSYRLDVQDSNSSGFVANFENTNTGTSADVLRLKISNTGTLSTNNSFIDLLDGDDDVNGRIRGNGSGGITYSSAFTGQHPTSIIMNANITTGMIVESTGEIWSKYTENMETGIPKVTISTNENSKKVFGVVANLSGSFAGMVKASNQSENETHIEVNSIGEGLVWVSNINGNIENGDYITSSDVYGIGQKQSDDILRSCTVAKCTENINWSEVTDVIQHNGINYKKYLATCTYHCG